MECIDRLARVIPGLIFENPLVRLAVSRQSRGLLFLGHRSKSIDAKEVSRHSAELWLLPKLAGHSRGIPKRT